MSGRILGDYEVIKQVGQGALGAVFLAEHRFMKKQVMLKVLPEELASDRGFVQRFEQEMALLASLEHPHIVKIHNVSSAQGLFFLVSDCVVDEMGETTNLAQFVGARSAPLQEEEVLLILSQVADALDYAHAKKRGAGMLVHGGLKPNNILIGASKPSLQISLCDFGLTAVIGEAAMLSRTYRVVAETLGLAEQLFPRNVDKDRYPATPLDRGKAVTLHQSFLQSFAFLAPEQKLLEREGDRSVAIDSYAFGILCYSLLLQRIPEGRFPFPSQLRNDLCFSWDTLLAQCLAYDPADRPVVLATALEQVRCEDAAEVRQEAKKQDAVMLLDKLRMSNASRAEETPAMATATVHAEEAAHRPVLHRSELHRPSVDHDPAQSLQVDTTVKQYVPEDKSPKELEPISTEMIVVEGGTFYRGSQDGNRDEMPRHQVTIGSFAFDVHPVTNEQFVRFLEVMGGEKDHNHQDLVKLKESRIKRGGGKLSIESGYAKHPVTGVTWYGAVAYAKWLGKRLPTEAEWEIAAFGGGDGAHYATGDDIEKSQANFFSSDTTTVKSYAPNGFGLYDMAGNVYEWCADWYGYNYYESSAQEPDDPRGPVQGVYRVLRGGCWKSLKEDLRCSRRHRNNPGTTNSTYGFRCAADVQGR